MTLVEFRLCILQWGMRDASIRLSHGCRPIYPPAHTCPPPPFQCAQCTRCTMKVLGIGRALEEKSQTELTEFASTKKGYDIKIYTTAVHPLFPCLVFCCTNAGCYSFTLSPDWDMPSCTITYEADSEVLRVRVVCRRGSCAQCLCGVSSEGGRSDPIPSLLPPPSTLGEWVPVLGRLPHQSLPRNGHGLPNLCVCFTFFVRTRSVGSGEGVPLGKDSMTVGNDRHKTTQQANGPKTLLPAKRERVILGCAYPFPPSFSTTPPPPRSLLESLCALSTSPQSSLQQRPVLRFAVAVCVCVCLCVCVCTRRSCI